jgi:hypothetical protein
MDAPTLCTHCGDPVEDSGDWAHVVTRDGESFCGTDCALARIESLIEEEISLIERVGF